MTVQDPMKGAGRRLFRVAAVVLAAIAVGPVGTAMADVPEVTITSPLNGSVINNSTPSFEGTGDPNPEDGGPVTLKIYKEGTVIQTLTAKQEFLPLPEDGGTWSVGPAQGLKALENGTYTAQAKQITTPSESFPTPLESEMSVTFKVETTTSSPPPVEPEQPRPVTPPGPPPPPPAPTASFSWFPSVPQVGQSVSLVSTSTDSASAITAFAWAPTGAVFHAGGPLLTTSFSTPGGHVVRLLVTDANGLSNVATQTIPVIAAPFILMQPFPIVRFAGSENASGVHLRLLTVQAPVGARVTVSCHGHGCPAKSQGQIALSRKKSAGTVVVEFRRFERSLPIGVVLEIRVSKPGMIGKFTRFIVRRGKLPERIDTCLDAAGVSPLVCPSS